MYGEIDGVEGDYFETHLADCTTCTDDFAAISNARFSVFEWRKEEFDLIATPNIVIPELAKSKVVADNEVGWFGALTGLLAFARSPLPAAAVLLGCLGVGFIALSYFRNIDSLVKVEVPAVKNDAPVNTTRTSDSVIETKVPDDEPIEPIRTSARSGKQAELYKAPVKAKRAVNNEVKRMPKTQTAQKPALNDFKEEADESLRLADLFDEVGG